MRHCSIQTQSTINSVQIHKSKAPSTRFNSNQNDNQSSSDTQTKSTINFVQVKPKAQPFQFNSDTQTKSIQFRDKDMRVTFIAIVVECWCLFLRTILIRTILDEPSCLLIRQTNIDILLIWTISTDTAKNQIKMNQRWPITWSKQIIRRDTKSQIIWSKHIKITEKDQNLRHASVERLRHKKKNTLLYLSLRRVQPSREK